MIVLPNDRKIKPGDIFCSVNPFFVGFAINHFQKKYSKDKKAKHSHSGVIISNAGDTFEVLFKTKKSDLRKYIGYDILIGRHKDMNYNRFVKGYGGLLGDENRIYPFHRWLFFVIGKRRFSFSKAFKVCSESTKFFIHRSGLCGCHGLGTLCWRGWTPDNVADLILKSEKWEVVYNGKFG